MIFMNLFRKQKEKLAYNIYNSKNTGVFLPASPTRGGSLEKEAIKGQKNLFELIFNTLIRINNNVFE